VRSSSGSVRKNILTCSNNNFFRKIYINKVNRRK